MVSDAQLERATVSWSPISWLIGLCLRNKFVVLALVLLTIGWGLGVAPFRWEMGGFPRSPVPVDAIPDIGENQQILFTEWPGHSPQDVEDQITYPLTASLMGIPGVTSIRSYSMFGFAMIHAVFRDDVDFYWSRARLLEKLASLPIDTLPEGVRPVLGPDATALGQVFWYTLEGLDDNGQPTGGWDLHELRTIQDWTVRFALLSTEDVSEVASVGGFVQEYHVDVDPEALQAYGVTLEDVLKAVQTCNVDIGARTIEINKVEYFIRSLGFVKRLEDIENAVIDVSQTIPLKVKHVAKVTLGPALRRGVLDKEGAEAVGGAVVARFGSNPLTVIDNIKKRIEEITPGLPRKILANGKVSQVHIVPFYDRSRLIHETLDTLQSALTQEILVTIIVVIVLVGHLRSSVLVAGLLPLAVLICFIAMKLGEVDANIVALSGIAIAIGTIVDMGVIVCENIVRHLSQARPTEDRLKVIRRASCEVGGAVVTAVSTTVVSFLPVFTMEAAEGKLFRPLAYTKTFALVAAVVIALTVLPSAAYVLFAGQRRGFAPRRVFHALTVVGGIVIGLLTPWWWLAITVVLLGLFHVERQRLPHRVERGLVWLGNGAAAITVCAILAHHWLPLGAEAGPLRNNAFVVLIVGGLLGAFRAFEVAYPTILRWCLGNKLTFLSLPGAILTFGAYVWFGPSALFGPIERVRDDLFASQDRVETLIGRGLLEPHDDQLAWSKTAIDMEPREFADTLESSGLAGDPAVMAAWSSAKYLRELRGRTWEEPDNVRNASLTTKLLWTLARDWNGRGREFMPPFDEGSYLYMPVTMPHASIGEVHDVLRKQDMRIGAIPEVDSVVGKLGRIESPLDPAPISMIEIVINIKQEFLLDDHGDLCYFRSSGDDVDLFRAVDGTPLSAPDGKPYFVHGKFERDDEGRLIPDPHGRPFRLWRPQLDPALNAGREAWPGIVRPHNHYHTEKKSGVPDNIWDAVVDAARVPGTTSAPRLQPIGARIVMLQTGMRAPMGVRIKGPTLSAIENVGLQIERFLKELPEIDDRTVIADRIIGKPYLEIEIDRDAIARYGIKMKDVQDVIDAAVGGKTVTTTVEGRQRFKVRVRYLRELRDNVEAIKRILVEGRESTNMQVPVALLVQLDQIAKISVVRGPHVIKSEDTFLVAYVLFDRRDGYAELEAVEQARRYLELKLTLGELELPDGVSYTFAGTYENQIRSENKLLVVLPVAMLTIIMILHIHFRSAATTMIVFSGVSVAFAGGFIMMWLYAQPWFLDVSIYGRDMRDLFQVHPIHLSVAVWVGFLALFGIATDDGVLMATYLKSSLANPKIATRDDIRAATVAAGRRRVRPCLVTTGTTILALIPVLSSTGRGSDIMVPMAIPTFGGMIFEVITMLVVPTLYCALQELKLSARRPA